MKIFPLKLMSNYDRAQNIMNIIGNPKHIHVIANENKLGTKAETDTAKQNMWNTILYKYSTKIGKIAKGITKNHGKESSRI